jgi:MFS transporter, DHA2 family, multidrug resistance protein
MNAGAKAGVNRPLIVGSLMLATVMNSLDTTIANVALPRMMGSVSASADEITWVLTSYIVAAAIVMPLTGWVAGRFGRKQLFLVSIAGFTVASAMCGAAQSLTQIVIFRLLQGAFGAALVPLAQAELVDLYTPEEQGPIMAIWGMGTLLGPIIGPALGGWLTENFNWRWVFYINLPFGVLAFAGVMAFLHDKRHAEKVPFDFMGFAFLGLAIGAFQLFLDRGQDKAWFESSEIWIEAVVASLAFFLFVIHTATADRPFLPRALIRDVNFVAGTVFGFFLGLLVFATLALLPPMLETLMGYPVVTTGLVTAPRGLGSLVSMFVVGQLVNRVDPRLIIAAGVGMNIVALYGMTRFSLGMDSSLVLWTGVVQGLGIGLIFVPLTTLAFATLGPAYRADGASVFTLVRNLGASAGISIMQALFSNNTTTVHARLVEGLRPDNPNAHVLAPPFSLTAPPGAAALNAEVTRQASMVAYIDGFGLMCVGAAILFPLILLMRRPARTATHEHSLVIE